jgi:hypothetical protein
MNGTSDLADSHVDLMEVIIVTVDEEHKCIRDVVLLLPDLGFRLSGLGISADSPSTIFLREVTFSFYSRLVSDIFNHASKWHHNDAPT